MRHEILRAMGWVTFGIWATCGPGVAWADPLKKGDVVEFAIHDPVYILMDRIDHEPTAIAQVGVTGNPDMPAMLVPAPFLRMIKKYPFYPDQPLCKVVFSSDMKPKQDGGIRTVQPPGADHRPKYRILINRPGEIHLYLNPDSETFGENEPPGEITCVDPAKKKQWSLEDVQAMFPPGASSSFTSGELAGANAMVKNVSEQTPLKVADDPNCPVPAPSALTAEQKKTITEAAAPIIAKRKQILNSVEYLRVSGEYDAIFRRFQPLKKKKASKAVMTAQEEKDYADLRAQDRAKRKEKLDLLRAVTDEEEAVIEKYPDNDPVEVQSFFNPVAAATP